MPKIIKNPEDRILQAARNRLLDKDLSSFSLRGVAADCGIAVGTIYNYFKDKESLMAASRSGASRRTAGSPWGRSTTISRIKRASWRQL